MTKSKLRLHYIFIYMKVPYPRLALSFVTAATVTLSGCNKDADPPAATGQVKFRVENTVGTQPLALNTTVATTQTGETFTISLFEYYLSNIRLTKSDGTVYVAPDTYFLVNQDKPASLSFAVAGVPAGEYTGVSFIVGVDAQKTGFTDPLALTGDLNPANNMYWTWNSGHVFLKMQGTRTTGGVNKPLTCHIGGYAAPTSAIVTAAPSFNGTKLVVRADQTPEVVLRADATKLFDGPNPVNLATFTGAEMPGTQAMQIAQNYGVGMLTVSQIKPN
jgi:hypothetical protein